MTTFGSVDEVLEFAIRREEEAVEFYTGLAGRMEIPDMRDVFLSFAREEKGHRARLVAVREGKQAVRSVGKVEDLKIADYVVDVEPTPGMNYRDALVLAMKKEKAAFRLYQDLASGAPDATMRDLFLSLAQDEARHKLRFELEYDDTVLKWN
jgi:rubrerythrin